MNLSMSRHYHLRYFNSKIFDYDYAPIASAIMEEYNPVTVIEFGCGNGELSKALARAGSAVTAIDGYSSPDFAEFDTIEFHKVNLNDPDEIKRFITSMNRKFNVAVCSEVAEHLNPDVSKDLINLLTTMSDIVIFSAAVPEQDGDGHINCQSRDFWHELFAEKGFFVADSIRQKIRKNEKVGKWYRLNIVDYVKLTDDKSLQYTNIIKRLVASESEASGSYYLAQRKLEKMQMIFNFGPIKAVFNFRNTVKKFIGRKPVELPYL